MRVKKERKPIHLNCVDCGHPFTALNGNALRCLKCRKVHKLQQNNESRAMRQTRAKCSRSTQSTLMDDVREVDAYNLAHGTRLSYGQYFLLRRSGKL
jgi:hypothetical protein